MEKLFDDKVLDDLFNQRCDGVIAAYLKIKGETEAKKHSRETEEELQNIMTKEIQDEDVKQLAIKKVHKFGECVLAENEEGNRIHYKKGFVDALLFANEVSKYLCLNELNSEGIVAKIEEYMSKKIDKGNSNMFKILDTSQDIEKLKNQYPKVRSFLENEKISQFTEDEMKAILKYIRLNNLALENQKQVVYNILADEIGLN